MFLIGLFGFLCWVIWADCIFWRLTPCQFLHFQYFLPFYRLCFYVWFPLLLCVCVCVWDIRECSTFTFTCSFSQCHILNRLLSIVYSCLLCQIIWPYVWVYFWASYTVALIYISIFVPVLYCFDNCNFSCSLKSGSLIPPVPFFFLKITLAIKGLLHFLCKI